MVKRLWSGFKRTLHFIQGLGTATLGIMVLFLLVAAIFSGGPQMPEVQDGTVLVVRPTGDLVEQPLPEDPVEAFFRRELDNAPPRQSSFHDLLTALERAKDDDRIVAVQLDTSRLLGAGIANLHEIADKLRALREAGKPIYAVSGSYTQAHYLLAAEASQIFLNDYGNTLLTGYGIYPTYYAKLLEKLGVTVNVFRVGTYKAAVEPYTLSAMSDAAREANQDFLGDLWGQYLMNVGNARGIAPEELQATLDNFAEAFVSTGGDFADFALASNWIDTKSAGRSWRQVIADAHGTGKSYTEMSYQTYLAATEPAIANEKSEIAVIVVEGAIAPGPRRSGVAGADDIVRDIRRAKDNSTTKAIVLRVNSPGGSQYASEMIRQALAGAQKADIPVIVSMGPVAASGGYWVSASADEIWAAPTTITGSIGIFAMIPTFEQAAEKWGVAVDGVGTTALTGGFNPLGGLSAPIKSVLQSNINRGYEDFLSLVAENRQMSAEFVDGIAQGRVWSGTKAKDLGLVDHLGSFRNAVDAAAQAAGGGSFALNFYEKPLSPWEAFMADLLNVSGTDDADIDKSDTPVPVVDTALAEVAKARTLLSRFNDPGHSYVLCLTCEVQ